MFVLHKCLLKNNDTTIKISNQETNDANPWESIQVQIKKVV